MQQNQGQVMHKTRSSGREDLKNPFQGVGTHLKMLCEHFPKGSAACKSAKQSLAILKKIESTLKETEKNNTSLDDLNRQFSQNLKSIKIYLAEQTSDRFFKLINTFHQLENSVRTLYF